MGASAVTVAAILLLMIACDCRLRRYLRCLPLRSCGAWRSAGACRCLLRRSAGGRYRCKRCLIVVLPLVWIRCDLFACTC